MVLSRSGALLLCVFLGAGCGGEDETNLGSVSTGPMGGGNANAGGSGPGASGSAGSSASTAGTSGAGGAGATGGGATGGGGTAGDAGSAGESGGAGKGGSSGSAGKGGSSGSAGKGGSSGSAGTGLAGSAGSAGSAGIPGSCPGAPPSMMETCATEGLTCGYGDCAPTCECVGGAWACGPIDPCIPPCPAEAPAFHSTCPQKGMACGYDLCAASGNFLEQCTCDENGWTCLVSDEFCPVDCPKAQPQPGAACGQAPLSCTYDSCCPVDCECVAGVWACSLGTVGLCDNICACSDVPVTPGEACGLEGVTCGNSCWGPCTCKGGAWACEGQCAKCPEEQPTGLGGFAECSDFGQSCAYPRPAGGDVVCTCQGGGQVPDHWACSVDDCPLARPQPESSCAAYASSMYCPYGDWLSGKCSCEMVDGALLWQCTP
jgi:hypothetical protein